MDTEHLRAFLAVADHLHFGRAADELHLAQPHLSRVVRALEDDLQAPLFTRTTRKVGLTPAGHALVEPARAILARCDTARAAVRAAQTGESGRVRVTFAGPSSLATVGRLAAAVRQRHPLIKLELRPGRYGVQALNDVLDDMTDLAIARFPSEPQGVDSRCIGRETLVVVVPADHRLAGAREVSVADLREESFIFFPDSSGSSVRRVFVEQCQSAGFSPRVVQESPDSWTTVALVAAGAGVHVTIDAAIPHILLEGVHVVRLNDYVPPIFVYLIWRSGNDDAALAKVLGTAGHVADRAGRPTDPG